MPLSKERRRSNMPMKGRTEFANPEEWMSYVRDCVPVADREYVLACGRTELFMSFYEMRRHEFPAEFTEELSRIQALSEPHRTVDLDRLNERIFGSLTELLFHESQPARTEAAAVAPVSPNEQVQELLNHLTEKNPYFALWVDYKRGHVANLDTREWEDNLSQELGSADEDAIEFAKAMAEMDKLLCYFQDRNLPLPRYFFERIWFLHYLRGRERMLQTRALLQTLTMEIAECTSA